MGKNVQLTLVKLFDNCKSHLIIKFVHTTT